MKTYDSLHTLLAAAIAGSLSAAGCAGQAEEDPGCAGAKCDLPDDPTERACTLRRADAYSENQLAFQERFLRWSCADTEGVTGVDRGQEYCEYFAVVELPPAEEGAEAPPSSIVGRLIEVPPESPDDPEALPTYETTALEIDLSANQVWALEEDPTEVVGQCVFTSWNEDIPGPVPACDESEGYAGSCPEVAGVPVTAEDFRMKFDVNSTEAAQFLVEDCLAYPEGGDPDDPEDPLHDDFFRGCLLNADINETEFRKSDTTLCAAAMRLAECECWPREGDADFPVVLSPWERRGFPLGTWSDPGGLPTGCRYVDVGDGSQTIVTCDLNAQDVLTYTRSLKNLCRERYGPNVVVHVPIPPSDSVVCYPEESESPYAKSCSATPWVLAE